MRDLLQSEKSNLLRKHGCHQERMYLYFWIFEIGEETSIKKHRFTKLIVIQWYLLNVYKWTL